VKNKIKKKNKNKIENNLYKIIDKEGEVIGVEKRFEGYSKEDIKFLKEWKGEKGKMYFWYGGPGMDMWEEDCKDFEEVKKKISSGWEDFNEEKLFDNVLFVDDGFYIKVI
jgi:hypothetical protein